MSKSRAATISPDGLYRYDLTRQWSTRPLLAWVGLNPSRADAYLDDPTIRRCVGFSKRWGYGSMVMLNLFALRSTDPTALLTHWDPTGPENWIYLDKWLYRAARVVVAWGTFAHRIPNRLILPALPFGKHLWCLGKNQDGSPRHPLRLPVTAELEPYWSSARSEAGTTPDQRR